LIGMVADMVWHARSGQVPARADEAVDLWLWVLLPSDVEGAKLREKCNWL
jgi:hypothetical protein